VLTRFGPNRGHGKARKPTSVKESNEKVKRGAQHINGIGLIKAKVGVIPYFCLRWQGEEQRRMGGKGAINQVSRGSTLREQPD